MKYEEIMDIKYLSRKFVLSGLLAIIATLLVWWKLIEPEQWQWVIMATVISYIGGRTIEKATLSSATGRKEWGGKNGEKKMLAVVLWDRLKSLFSREFVLTLVTLLVTSALLYRGCITSGVWFLLASTLAGFYNILTAVSKV